MERTIRVTGKGKLALKPDRIRILITVEGTEKNYDSMMERSANATGTLNELAEKNGFQKEELKTLRFDVDTVYDSYQGSDKNWKKRFRGYKFTHELKLETDIDRQRLGRLFYDLAHCELNPEFSLAYTVRDRENAKKELIRKAVGDSVEKAQILADAAGVSLGDIRDIDYSWGEVNFMTRLSEEIQPCGARIGEEIGSAYDFDMEPDDIEVTDTVTVVWEIR